jgi:hypothetical protein
LQRRSGKDRKDVQILTLDDRDRKNKRETFRREGDAEILELEEAEAGAEADDEDDFDVDEELNNSDEASQFRALNEARRNQRLGPTGLDVLEEVDEGAGNTPLSRAGAGKWSLFIKVRKVHSANLGMFKRSRGRIFFGYIKNKSVPRHCLRRSRLNLAVQRELPGPVF